MNHPPNHRMEPSSDRLEEVIQGINTVRHRSQTLMLQSQIFFFCFKVTFKVTVDTRTQLSLIVSAGSEVLTPEGTFSFYTWLCGSFILQDGPHRDLLVMEPL